MNLYGMVGRWVLGFALIGTLVGGQAGPGLAGQEATADTIRGVVRNGRFQPVVNAHAQLVRVWPERSLAEPEQRPATTDRDGGFALRFAGRGDRALVRITAAGYAPVLVWGSRGQPIRALLPRSIPVTVKVLDEETREPIRNATVRTFLLGWPASHDGVAFEEALTDPDGTVRVRLAGGDTTVVASAPFLAPAARELEVRAGTREIVLALDAGATLRGQVRDRTGKLVAGAVVTARAEPCYQATRRTDDTGAFFFTHVPRGKHLTPC